MGRSVKKGPFADAHLMKKVSAVRALSLIHISSFRVRTDEESGQTIISGMGELHLEIIVDRLKREFGVDANVGAPQVAYRECIKKSVEQEGKFVKQSGGRGQYGLSLIHI